MKALKPSALLLGAIVLPTTLVAQTQSVKSLDEQWDFVYEYCVPCHNEEDYVEGISFEYTLPELVHENADVWERAVRKVRLGMMPPQDADQPEEHQVTGFISSLEDVLDEASELNLNSGSPTLHRVNRTEYANSIRDLLGLNVDASELLPSDDSADGFDNMSQALTISPALLEGYLSASGKVASLAVGDPNMAPAYSIYRTEPDQSQNDHVEGAPLGTQGGIVVEHFFPLDGEYEFEPKLYRGLQQQMKGLEFPHSLEVTIDKVRVHLADFGGFEDNKRSHQNGFAMADEVDARLKFTTSVTAGPHTVAVNFISKSPAQTAEIWKEFERTAIDGNEDKGVPHLDKFSVLGPISTTGVGDTPSRREIFTCQPGLLNNDELACANEIITRLASKAYRRPIRESEMPDLLGFFELGRQDASFDKGIETAIRRIISGPEFIFRAELDPPGIAPNTPYQISDLELASRLAFFLWSSLPDDELLDLAGQNLLRDPTILEAQVQRMIASPKSQSLVNNFASQWLTLRNLEGITPDPELFPDFDNNLRNAFVRESQLLFNSIIAEDRNILDILNADYTFVNERLALHYGIPGVYGSRFRRVDVVDEARRGILGHGSILTLTSVSTRTSAVGRGKWVLTNLLATPPPAPPPDVPTLEESATGEPQTLREQLSAHRANPVCASCHDIMDPIGFSLENFDAVGRWRDMDGGIIIDASDTMFDGTPISGAADLTQFLLNNEYMFVQTLTQKLLGFALGRPVEYFDMPAVRKIVRDADANDNRFSSIIMGVINSKPFQMRMSAPMREDSFAVEQPIQKEHNQKLAQF